jgi:hypothetical protein
MEGTHGGLVGGGPGGLISKLPMAEADRCLCWRGGISMVGSFQAGSAFLAGGAFVARWSGPVALVRGVFPRGSCAAVLVRGIFPEISLKSFLVQVSNFCELIGLIDLIDFPRMSSRALVLIVEFLEPNLPRGSCAAIPVQVLPGVPVLDGGSIPRALTVARMRSLGSLPFFSALLASSAILRQASSSVTRFVGFLASWPRLVTFPEISLKVSQLY